MSAIDKTVIAGRATEILTEYGLTVPCDSRWIAAAMLCEFGKNPHVNIRTVMAACRLCSKRTREDNEALARSYGL